MTRRAVLVSGAAALTLAACSSKSDGGGAGSADDTTAPTASLLALFTPNGYITAQAPQRLAFAIADPQGGMTKTGPNPLTFTITGPGGTHSTQRAAAHSQGLPYTYYPLHFTPPKAGDYTAEATVDGSKATATFAVVAKGAADVPGPTDKLPAMQTPTVANHLGVDPICTQDPVCKLHAVSLNDALGQGKPVAYLVATPKFCQTGICGPVLDVLEATAPDYVDKITFIHQEVYQSAKQAAEKGNAATLTKAVQALKLQSEPVLFVTGRDGVIRHRLDTAYDRTELRQVLDDVLA